MTRSRLPFIDWMKFLGISLIVYGHVAGTSIDWLTAPIYAKQLGVAFFLFVAGFSLAREQRPVRRVLFNRLFDVFLFGISCALLMSAITYLRTSRLSLSNYLPFLLGVNVLFNNFPANPTTWFSGTYLHLLLIWALLLRGRRIGPGAIAVAAAGEILLRAILAETAGLFVAYMAFPNWMTVFLLGMYYGQQHDEERRAGLVPYLLGLGLLVAAWPLAWSACAVEPSFPFMRFLIGSPLADSLVTSAAVTAIYGLFTWFVYQVTRWLDAPAPVRFCARNTLLVFIVHMPLLSALIPPLWEQVSSYWGRVAVLMLFCFGALMLFSEVVRRLVRPEWLREKVWLFCTGASLVKNDVQGRKPSPRGCEHTAQPDN